MKYAENHDDFEEAPVHDRGIPGRRARLRTGPGLLCFGLLWLAAVRSPAEEASRHRPQNQAELETMVRIAWSRGPDLPRGFQDSAGGFIGSSLVTVCGYQVGKDQGTRPEKYPRGFINLAWALDLRDRGAAWVSLPNFPGEQRQGLFSATVGDALFCWGGFSYTEPCCYQDGYRLSRADGRWKWSQLPPLPWKLTFSGICSIGGKIYVLGGHDYDNKDGGGMHTLADRTGKIGRLGARLLMIDAGDLRSGWRHLAQCPGTPRGAPAMAQVGGKIYVLGGAVGALKVPGADSSRNPASLDTCSCVDNWVYNPGTDRWSRLRDLPVSSGGFPSGEIVFHDRYILLVGGFQWGKVMDPDGTMRPDYGRATIAPQGKRSYYCDVFVYDTKTDRFGIATNLPLNDFHPMVVVRGDILHLLGGETGGSTLDGVYYPHHPDLYLRGKLVELGRTGRATPKI